MRDDDLSVLAYDHVKLKRVGAEFEGHDERLDGVFRQVAAGTSMPFDTDRRSGLACHERCADQKSKNKCGNTMNVFHPMSIFKGG